MAKGKSKLVKRVQRSAWLAQLERNRAKLVKSLRERRGFARG